MRFYIKKLSKGTIVVYRETTIQSILSDFITIIVLIVAIGLDILFSIYIAHSAVIDVLVVSMILLYMFGFAGKKKTEFKKEEIIKEIENL